MRKNLLNERKIARNFMQALHPINNMSELSVCFGCNERIQDCCCNEDYSTVDYNKERHPDHGEAHHEMKIGHDDVIPPEELYHHFDLNDDGQVTTQEYVDHINYHAENPESMEHYENKNVPCNDSYQMSMNHFCSDESSLEDVLHTIISKTGCNCVESALTAVIDLLRK